VVLKSLATLFEAHEGRLIDKWAHYLPIYEHYFARFRGTACRILEIGVSHGGSLQLWKAYFGPKAQIVGIDIDPRCQDYEEDQITIHILDQANLRTDPEWPYDYDIVIDDGSHQARDQEASFKALWPRTRGLYVIEDCHTGWPTLWSPGAYACHLYPWLMVIEPIVFEPQRIVTGTPSRPLNADEQAAYAQYLHPDV
jgi:hypothetical protein